MDSLDLGELVVDHLPEVELPYPSVCGLGGVAGMGSVVFSLVRGGLVGCSRNAGGDGGGVGVDGLAANPPVRRKVECARLSLKYRVLKIGLVPNVGHRGSGITLVDGTTIGLVSNLCSSSGEIGSASTAAASSSWTSSVLCSSCVISLSFSSSACFRFNPNFSPASSTRRIISGIDLVRFLCKAGGSLILAGEGRRMTEASAVIATDGESGAESLCSITDEPPRDKGPNCCDKLRILWSRCPQAWSCRITLSMTPSCSSRTASIESVGSGSGSVP